MKIQGEKTIQSNELEYGITIHTIINPNYLKLSLHFLMFKMSKDHSFVL